jgi:hypothetical protein
VIQGGDPNTADVFHIANMVPDTAISKEEMANTLVMDVQEQLFPSADMVQNRDHIQLAKDKKCGKTVLEKYPRFGSLEEAIAKSLYIWFGCVQIDKALYFYLRR